MTDAQRRSAWGGGILRPGDKPKMPKHGCALPRLVLLTFKTAVISQVCHPLRPGQELRFYADKHLSQLKEGTAARLDSAF